MRKLTAILFSDIVGFSKQMSENESKTLKILKANTGLHHRIVKQFGGNVVKAMGDGYLCTFNSSVDAVLAGDQIIRAVKKLNLFELRVGIHVGDVVHNKGGLAKGKDVYGDGVNIAARIESNAPGQGVWVSERVAADLENHEFIDLKSAGMFELKNIPKPMEIFEVLINDIQSTGVDTADMEPSAELQKKIRLFGSIVLLLITGVLAWSSWVSWQDHNAPDSIAVLPFEFIGPEKSFEYLSTGFTADLSRDLGNIKTIKILSKATAKKLAQSSELLSDLDVDYIIEGAVKYSNPKLEIQVMLVTSDDDETLWSQEYSGDINSSEQFVSDIASQVKVILAVR